MKMRVYAALACLLFVAGTVVGCGSGGAGSAADQTAQTSSLVKMELTSDSMYPYLTFVNKGSGQADNVQVIESKTNEGLTALALLKKSGTDVNAKSAPEKMVLGPGDGAQYQIKNKELHEYLVTWTEGGEARQQKLVTREAQKIETH